MANMLQFFKPGDVLYGYCNGAFGRDSHGTKTCISVRPKYALFETDDGRAEVLNFYDKFPQLYADSIPAWKAPTDPDET